MILNGHIEVVKYLNSVTVKKFHFILYKILAVVVITIVLLLLYYDIMLNKK